MVNKTSTESTDLLGGTKVGNGTFPSGGPSSSSSAPEISAQEGIGMFHRAVGGITSRFTSVRNFNNRGVRRIEESPALQKHKANKILKYIRTEASTVHKLSLAIMDEEITYTEFKSLIEGGYLVVPDNLTSVLENLIDTSSSLNFKRINFVFSKTKGNSKEQILVDILTKVLKEQTGSGQIISDIMDQLSPEVSLVVAGGSLSSVGIATALSRKPNITTSPKWNSHLSKFSRQPVFTNLLYKHLKYRDEPLKEMLQLFMLRFKQDGLEEEMMGLIYDFIVDYHFISIVKGFRETTNNKLNTRDLKAFAYVSEKGFSFLHRIKLNPRKNYYDQFIIDIKKCIQDIQELGIDLNKGDKKGDTLIHRLMDNKNHEEIVKELLELDFDVNIQNKKGNTPLHLAILGGRDTVVEPLLNKKEININLENNSGVTPIHAAAKLGNLHAIELLDIAQVEISPQTLEGNTPLHLAAVSTKTDAIQKLHQMDPASLDSKNKSGNTPLMFVIGSENLSNLEPISELLELGADVNTKNTEFMTPLHLSAVRTSLSKELIEALTQKGAQVNSQDQDGNTPLLLAAKSNNLEAVEALLSIGETDVLITNSNGKNFFELLFSNSSQKRIDLAKVIANVKKIATPAQIAELNTENLQTLMKVYNLKLA